MNDWFQASRVEKVLRWSMLEFGVALADTVRTRVAPMARRPESVIFKFIVN